MKISIQHFDTPFSVQQNVKYYTISTDFDATERTILSFSSIRQLIHERDFFIVATDKRTFNLQLINQPDRYITTS